MRNKRLYAEVEYKYTIRTFMGRTSMHVHSMGKKLDIHSMSIEEKQLAVNEISLMLKILKRMIINAKIKHVKGRFNRAVLSLFHRIY